MTASVDPARSTSATAPPSSSPGRGRRAARVGAVLRGAVVLFLLLDGVTHVLAVRPVLDAFTALGFAPSAARGIGILELVCLAVHLVPRTSVLGALLLTGYLGGAVAAHVRVSDPLLSTVLFPVYLGVALWAGLVLHRPALRSLLR